MTINVWSGLDYRGVVRMGEYEPRDRREARFQALVQQMRRLDPDLVFIQEANPLPRFARRLARATGLTAIHQVVNAGLRVGPVGIPVNLREGLVVLARRALQPRKYAAWKLSGGPGLHGAWVTLHWSETVYALVVACQIGKRTCFAVNVHLTWSLPRWPGLEELFTALPETERTEELRRLTLAWSQARDRRRARELDILLTRLQNLPQDTYRVVAGDFNAEPEAPEIRDFFTRGSFLDVIPEPLPGRELPATWDPQTNQNIRYAAQETDARGRRRRGRDLMSILAAAWPRRIDYILLGPTFKPDDILECRLTLTEKTSGVYPSDHFGVMADVRFPDEGP